ncbi:phosphate/phosphite/phosphonate ABC transporter substrate-binding protein [uncultured Desulfobacter sp.]|uniref:phosphate/phosphite/phosphonate ABC transporter substrate-binding protein n=1 Tax=uncultured Desulfobacter sp. TaxID=240139 RepID=UPI002AA8284B|nr:phosphate/phosphite/phosphonate ABC transporter substrate-binding protein [uncultured Desulfobacter sp.]
MQLTIFQKILFSALEHNYKRAGSLLLAIASFVLLVWLPGYTQPLSKTFNLCIFPCTDETNSFRKFHPLVTYIKQTAGLNISLVFHDDLAGFERALKNGSLDFVIQDPHVYVKLSDKYNNAYILQALTSGKETTQCGVVVVRKDSGLKGIKDLKGKTVMFGSKLSSPRWIAARHLFEKNGIEIDRDLRDYFNKGCCEDVAFNVFLNVVDAGVVCDHFLQEHERRQQELGLDAAQLAVIAATDRVPTKIFSAVKAVRDDDTVKMVRALMHLDSQDSEHRRILESADLAGFRKASSQNLRQIMEWSARMQVD